MAKPRVTATDRLANVIDVVGLGRRTGLLSAEREFGTMLEEAEIYFVSGNPIYASLGPLYGHDALSQLSQWGVCRFCFDPLAPQPIPNISGVLPAVDPSSPSGFSYAYTPSTSSTTNTSASNGQAGQYGPPSSVGRAPSGPSSPISRTSWTSPVSAYPSGSLGGVSGAGRVGPASPGASGANWDRSGIFDAPASGMSNGMANGMANGVSNGMPRVTPQGASGPATPSAARPNSNPTMTPAGGADAQANVLRRPRRAPDVRDLINVVTSYNLSRAHRTILLLADGEHSTLDLARLSGKPVDEVLALVGELEGRGLIYYYQ